MLGVNLINIMVYFFRVVFSEKMNPDPQETKSEYLKFNFKIKLMLNAPAFNIILNIYRLLTQIN